MAISKLPLALVEACLFHLTNHGIVQPSEKVFPALETSVCSSVLSVSSWSAWSHCMELCLGIDEERTEDLWIRTKGRTGRVTHYSLGLL